MMTATAMKITDSESQGFGPVVSRLVKKITSVLARSIVTGLLRMNPTSASSATSE
jgi:hypothetical protein